MKNIFYKSPKTVAHIPTEKVKVKFTLQKKGFINLIGTKRGKRTAYHASVSIKKGIAKVKTFASRKALKAYQIADQLKTKALKAKKLCASFIKSGRIESHILTAKDNLKKAIFNGENSYTIASLYINVCKAIKEVKDFKYSLPKYIRVNLF